MDNPRIRYVEAIPVEQDGQELIILRDTDGVMEKPLIVSKDAAFLLSLMDGTRSLRDLQAEYMRAFGQLLYIEHIEKLVETLDKNFLLFNDNYKNYIKKIRDDYETGDIREPFLAGKSYPENRMELLLFLDNVFKSDGKTESSGDITGILAPHIDYDRGIDVYRGVYRYLKNVKKPLVIILGVSHKPAEKIVNISLKDFSTPIDTCTVSEGIRELIRQDDVLMHYINEWPHRSEHSIELQLPLLQFVMKEEFEILPILTGSMHEYVEGIKSLPDREIEDIAEGLKRVISRYGKPYLIISGVDLAHIGEQFGDRYSLDRFSLNESKAKDDEILKSIEDVDADKFYKLVKDEKDRRRICGLTSIYFQLKLLSGSRCNIVGYKQWSDGKSSVSFAGAVFYR